MSIDEYGWVYHGFMRLIGWVWMSIDEYIMVGLGWMSMERLEKLQDLMKQETVLT